VTDNEILIWYEGLERVTCNTNEPEKAIIGYVREALATAQADALESAARLIEVLTLNRPAHSDYVNPYELAKAVRQLVPASSQRAME
jgi:hypothetical protein